MILPTYLLNALFRRQSTLPNRQTLRRSKSGGKQDCHNEKGDQNKEKKKTANAISEIMFDLSLNSECLTIIPVLASGFHCGRSP